MNTPEAPTGWVLRMHYFDGRPSKIHPVTEKKPRTFGWCNDLMKAWEKSVFNYGESKWSIEPAEGWESVSSDPLTAIVYGLVTGTVTEESALAQLRKMIKGAA